MPRDPDQLLALALSRLRGQHLKLVRTHEEILAAGRQARARAAETRKGLQEQREKRAETLAETEKLLARRQELLPPSDDPAAEPD